MEPLVEHLAYGTTIGLGPQAIRRMRRASDLRGVFQDADALETLIRNGDPVIYETFEPPVPEAAGHVMFGITVLQPGRVGDEYFMTKGHYHVQRQTAEVYAALRGRGYLVLQTEQGASRAVPAEAGGVVYVPPGWAHRTVNTGDEPLVLFYAFPADAGHDYTAVARSGFVFVVRDVNGTPTVVERQQHTATRWEGEGP